LRVVGKRAPANEKRCGLLVGEALKRVLAGCDKKWGRPRCVAGLIEMHRDDTCELALAFRVERQDRLCGDTMERASILLQK